MEISKSSLVLFRFLSHGNIYQLFRKNERWADWSLIGGKLDPNESWEEAAIREISEEVPEISSRHYTLSPLFQHPVHSGPTISRSTGKPTSYNFQFFVARFKVDPHHILSLLDPEIYSLELELQIPEKPWLGAPIHVAWSALANDFSHLPLSWDEKIPHQPKLMSQIL